MFPIVAIGAALLAGVGIAAATSSSKGEKAPTRGPDAAPSGSRPQSYIVTPIAGRYVQSGEELSMVDAVGKFIV
jgi:hypothetical protein